TKVVGGRRYSVEDLLRLLLASLPGEDLGHPERAGDERPLGVLQAVVAVVAPDEAFLSELLADEIGGPYHPLVVVADELGGGKQQQSGVEIGAAERAAEHPPMLVVAVGF